MTRPLIARFLIVLIILSASPEQAHACTMFKITEDGRTIVGNNEDWSNPHTRIWFEVGSEGEFGVAYVGFDDLNPQGAINEAGLVYDIFAMPYEEITDGEQKKAQPDDFLKTIMRTSATVEEVKSQLEAYNLQGFEQVMLLFIDRSGNYLIQERDLLTTGSDPHYVLSNFSPTRISDHSTVELPHFQKGRDMLTEKTSLELDYCASVLDALHQEEPYWGGTQYSTLYDLNEGKIFLYYFHDYDRSMEFDLRGELEKGNHILNIPDLFADVEKGREYMATYDAYEANLLLLESDATFSDPDTLANVTHKIVNGPPKKMIYANFYKIESIGQQWLEEGQYDNAISVFRINADNFDWIAGPFENLGKAYMLNGQIELAIENYNRVLAISPDDKKATAQLEKLKSIGIDDSTTLPP